MWICARCSRRTQGVGLRAWTTAVFPKPRSLFNSASSPAATSNEGSVCPGKPSFSTSAVSCKEHISQHGAALDALADAKSAKRKTATSLRRVALEAQRSRHFVRGKGRKRFIDPGVETKDITASCAAEQYDLPLAQRLLQQEGYDMDPLNTGLYPQVIHIQTPIYPIRDPDTGQDKKVGPGDVFIFPSGCVVSWNVPEKVQKRLVQRVLSPAAINSHLATTELEDMEYLEDPTRPDSQVIGDAIVLGAQVAPDTEGIHDDTDQPKNAIAGTDLTLAKIAFSSGIARSTKLAVLENLLSKYFETTKTIPTILSRGSKLRFTRSFILRKTGELLSIRAQLNLYSELTDTMPDLFWDSPSQLGLSDYYDQVGKALDVHARIRTLNEKMDYASEIAGVLRERLSEKHSTGLEWLIIFLISIEVAFELLRLWREHEHSKDSDGTEALFREWLARELHGSQRPDWRD
ncbi:MIOREX complex component 10 [Sphaceloma murrayae]|uniref:MIOREX complex component 10 n=1 Tax=Sphaceloma murrayae TaxID=2082308 RepID=A0A2K1R3I0_9PEZI|nr:MIOREX complex component 10 [Sphaceloma murrayae]